MQVAVARMKDLARLQIQPRRFWSISPSVSARKERGTVTSTR